jgi:hypothetical protein
MFYGGIKMSKKYTIYEIKISEDALATYGSPNISAKDMAENLSIDSVMTDFEWDEGILTGRVLDEISVEDALSELENVEFIDRVDES